MGESAGKWRKQYVYCPAGEIKTCLIHGLQHSSDECKVLVDFGAKYAKGKPTKDHGNNPVPKKTFNRQKGNNSIVNNVVDEILLNETQRLSAAREAPKFLDIWD